MSEQLPRNIYRHRKGYRGMRMVQGQRLRTRVYSRAEQAQAALEQLLAGEPEAVSEGAPLPELLRGIIESTEETGRRARRALLRLEGEANDA